MERKCKLSDMGNVQVIHILEEKIFVGATKIGRYEERELYYHELHCYLCLQRNKNSFT